MAGGAVTSGSVDATRVEAPVTFKAYLMCAFAAFGGIFFGYDSGYISGVLGMKYFIQQFEGLVSVNVYPQVPRISLTATRILPLPIRSYSSSRPPESRSSSPSSPLEPSLVPSSPVIWLIGSVVGLQSSLAVPFLSLVSFCRPPLPALDFSLPVVSFPVSVLDLSPPSSFSTCLRLHHARSVVPSSQVTSFVSPLV